MMTMKFSSVFIFFAWMMSMSSAFAPRFQNVNCNIQTSLARVTTAKVPTLKLHHSSSEVNTADKMVAVMDWDVSRRVALVTAAALAAGASPVVAANLERIVTKLERENRKEVNTKGAPEKHLPQVSVESNTVTVSIPHVMDPEKPHYIEYVWLMDVATNKVAAVQAFQATDPSPPTLIATNLPSAGKYIPMAFCNLHGLWEGDTISI